MPKASTPARSTRTPSASPTKGASSSPAKKAQPPITASSEWRASTIPAGQKITKKEADSQYRLKREDYNKLGPPERHLTKAGYVSLLYQEIDVERVAWEKHGGPNRFEAYLEKLSKTYEKKQKQRGLPFPAPSVYSFAGGSISIIAPTGSTPSRDNRQDQISKQRLLGMASGETWLVEKCEWNIQMGIDELNWQGLSPSEWTKAWSAAVRGLGRYPPRTPAPTQLSPQFQALRLVLDDAPKRKDERESNVRAEDGCFPYQDVKLFYWSPEYFTRVYKALIDIIKAHGLGDDGWRAARWIVYDEYAKTWKGIAIHEDQDSKRDFSGKRPWAARDHAYGWLHGRLPSGEKPLLDFAFGIKNDKPPPVWHTYNAMLPEEDI